MSIIKIIIILSIFNSYDYQTQLEDKYYINQTKSAVEKLSLDTNEILSVIKGDQTNEEKIALIQPLINDMRKNVIQYQNLKKIPVSYGEIHKDILKSMFYYVSIFDEVIYSYENEQSLEIAKLQITDEITAFVNSFNPLAQKLFDLEKQELVDQVVVYGNDLFQKIENEVTGLTIGELKMPTDDTLSN